MSDTVKFIIEIPKETYNAVCGRGLFLCPRDENSLVQTIKKAVPLDSVKAEIKEKYRDAEFMNEFIDGCNHTISEVLEILDNIGRNEDERL